jgi:hypothetical protein
VGGERGPDRRHSRSSMHRSWWRWEEGQPADLEEGGDWWCSVNMDGDWGTWIHRGGRAEMNDSVAREIRSDEQRLHGGGGERGLGVRSRRGGGGKT